MTTNEEMPAQGDISPPAELSQTRCGFIALIGAPNAGKSTLTNQIVGSKISIVTHKVQTTRASMRGIAIQEASQLILVDTPGIFAPKRRLDRAMVHAAWSGAQDADLVVLLVDVGPGVTPEVERILNHLQEAQDVKVPIILALNKIDQHEKEKLLECAALCTAKVEFAATFMISALDGDGVEDLRGYLAEHLPFGPWLYPEDQMGDAPLRYLAAEITREKLFLRLHEELPYASTVETTDWKTLKDGSARIEQTIYVERPSQKKIVLGKGGQAIKAISMQAREEIAEITETPVHLFIFVKVREKWGNDPERYRELGLEFPSE